MTVLCLGVAIHIQILGVLVGILLMPSSAIAQERVQFGVDTKSVHRARERGMPVAYGKVVIGFGNWGQSQWTNFDRAVGAADLIGTMALQSSLRDGPTSTRTR